MMISTILELGELVGKQNNYPKLKTNNTVIENPKEVTENFFIHYFILVKLQFKVLLAQSFCLQTRIEVNQVNHNLNNKFSSGTDE